MVQTTNKIQKILISDDVNENCVNKLRQSGFQVDKNIKLTKPELLEEVKKYDCLIVRSATKVTADVLQSGKDNLKLIARAGTGVDNIDVEEATKLNILVMNALGSNTLSAAELTCGMMMSMARHIPQAAQSMKEGKWDRSKYMGSELNGKTLAIIGLGRIGQEVGKRMRAFGMNIIGYDPITTPEQAAAMNIEFKELSAVWPLADYITIHVPLLPATKHMFNKEVFAKCKKGFRVLNCARGGIVNEADLFDSLQSEHCAGAALDTFEQEPPVMSDLLKHPKLIATPHIGASTKEAQNRVAVDIAEQIVNYVKQDKLVGGVNANKLKL